MQTADFLLYYIWLEKNGTVRSLKGSDLFMKLTKESIKHNVAWKGYRLPQYDIDAVSENTHKAPTWLHFGAGNLFLSLIHI